MTSPEGLAPPGKLHAELFSQVILRHLGAADADVVVGPRHGVDLGVVRTAPGQVMALTSDPVFIVPTFGWERATWFAVHILASDTAMSGLAPRWMAVDLNLPRELDDQGVTELWQGYAKACEDLGIAVVTGHTGRYDGTSWPMVGGATCMATGPEDGYVTSAMAQPGDQVVVTKGAAIEATALFGGTFPELLRPALGDAVVAAADTLFEAQTVVPEARIAAGIGLREDGVTALHDATEGGVLGGLVELAEASGVGLRIDRDLIPVRPEVRAICGHVGIDPYTAISEGTLLATVRPHKAGALLTALGEADIDAAVVGEVTPVEEGRRLRTREGEEDLAHPGFDPFWAAFAEWSASAAEDA